MNIFYYLIPAVLALTVKVLHHLFLDASGFRKKAWIIGGISALWAAIVLWLAHFFCSYARTMEECFLLWTLAFVIGCLFAAIQAWLLLLCRPKRQMTDTDKIKLKDF